MTSPVHSTVHLTGGSGGGLKPNPRNPRFICTRIPETALTAMDSGLPPSIGCQGNTIGGQWRGTEWEREDGEDALRVDIEVYGYRPMRGRVPCYRPVGGASWAEGGMCVRRLRLTVRALHPIYRRRGRCRRHLWKRQSHLASLPYSFWQNTTTPNADHRHAWSKHCINRVVSSFVCLATNFSSYVYSPSTD